MVTHAEDVLVRQNPATGEFLGQVPRTPVKTLGGIVARARAAQRLWGDTAWNHRRAFLVRWGRELSVEAEAWAAAIADEVGKPRREALRCDVIPTLDALRWTVRNGASVLADRRLGPGWQRLLLIPPARLRCRPVGVIGMVGTWNFPLMTNAPTIAQAVAAGNAVVWKPSELAPLVGLRLQQSLERAGMPEGLVSAVFGGPEVGAALVDSAIDKGVFTGGIDNGRRVLGTLSRRGIPALVELSGFDAAIVRDDAPLETTIPALTWGAFVGSGQACVAIKRVYVVGDSARWAEALAASSRRLRMGLPADDAVDLGPMISCDARDRFHRTIQATIAAGARLLAGGGPIEGPGWFYAPTVLQADVGDSAPEEALAGAFGPVVLVRGVADDAAAVEAANASPFGLSGSVWGRDVRGARAVADRLEVGMVAVNEAVTPSAQASAPFGGIKASGFGRMRGALGLREFVQPQTLHVRRSGGYRPQLFPYSARLDRMLALYQRVFHPHT